jgi:SAM-dependent methyltransferase
MYPSYKHKTNQPHGVRSERCATQRPRGTPRYMSLNRQPSAKSTNCAHGAVDRRGEGRVDSSAAAAGLDGLVSARVASCDRSADHASFTRSAQPASLTGAGVFTLRARMVGFMMKTIWHWMRLLAYSWRAVGPRRIARQLFAYSTDAEARSSDSGFDSTFGTDTTRELTPGEAALPMARRSGATMYLPSMDCDVSAMLDALAWPASLVRDATFVDIGSGKGRAVFLAAMRPFREVIGVELSPVLHAVAGENLTRMRETGALAAPVRLHHADATVFAVPGGPLVVYLYHPFREPIAAKVIDRIVASIAAEPRPVAILYGHPTLQRSLDEDVFARGGVLRRAHVGARETRRFRIGWSIWTNQAWLSEVSAPAWNAHVRAAGALSW